MVESSCSKTFCRALVFLYVFVRISLSEECVYNCPNDERVCKCPKGQQIPKFNSSAEPIEDDLCDDSYTYSCSFNGNCNECLDGK